VLRVGMRACLAEHTYRDLGHAHRHNLQLHVLVLIHSFHSVIKFELHLFWGPGNCNVWEPLKLDEILKVSLGNTIDTPAISRYSINTIILMCTFLSI